MSPLVLHCVVAVSLEYAPLSKVGSYSAVVGMSPLVLHCVVTVSLEYAPLSKVGSYIAVVGMSPWSCTVL